MADVQFANLINELAQRHPTIPRASLERLVTELAAFQDRFIDAFHDVVYVVRRSPVLLLSIDPQRDVPGGH